MLTAEAHIAPLIAQRYLDLIANPVGWILISSA
jgi:hypothetical protein